MKQAVINGSIVLPDRILADGAVIFENGIIEAVGEKEQFELSTMECIDAQGMTVGPGFVDIHCHAGGEVWTHQDPVSVAQYHLSGGATSLCCTLYHNIGFEGALEGGRRIKEAIDSGTPGNIVGIHFEGPFLNPKYGADSKKARKPDPNEYMEYLRRFGSVIRQWTFAPEIEGTDEFLSAVRSQGIAMAIGHSEASPQRVLEVAQKGVSICTHITNATGVSISPSTYAGTKEVDFDTAAILAGLYCEVINDSKGAHVRPMMIKFLIKAVGIDKIIGITDACASDGGEGDINIVNGEIFGSKLTMIKAAHNFKKIGLSTVDVFKVCSANPAKAINLNDAGTIEKGKKANLVFLSDQMQLKKVFLDGVQVRQF